MKLTNEKVYRCDHCNRAMMNKGAMTTHERMCRKNPNNMHKCFQYCRHLTKYVIGDDCIDLVATTHFTCDKNPDFELFSYKAERNTFMKQYVEGLTRMPLKCDSYEIEDGHDDEYIQETEK